MIPTPELYTYLRTVAAAAGKARSGAAREGYSCLVSGLRQAEAAELGGEAWGPLLAKRYRDVLENYLARWPISTPEVELPASG